MRINKIYPLLLVAFFAIALTAHAEVVNRIAAVVDEHVITLYEIEKTSAPIIQAFANSPEGRELDPVELRARISEIKKQVLKDMIEQKLLEAEVKRLGIPVSDREIDEYINRIKTANRMSDEQLSAMLAAEGSSLAKFRDQVKTQILREQYVQFRLKNKLEVDDDEARAYYKQHQEDFLAERILVLSEIRIALPPDATESDVDAARSRAMDAYQEVLGGANFAETAKKYSDGPTAKSGGSLGSWKENELAPSYRKTAEDMKPGEIAPPYRDDKGFVVLRCDEWEKSGYLTFEEVSGKIKAQLRKEAAERAMKSLAKELYKKSFVDIKIEDF